jgi:hypothetical protein
MVKHGGESSNLLKRTGEPQAQQMAELRAG